MMRKDRETRIFSKSDFEAFTRNDNAMLKSVVGKAKDVENANIEPTLKDRSAMLMILKAFVKKKGRIIYGGFAINELIRVKSSADTFYDFSVEAPDIEFYSSDAVLDAKELCDLFHANGYPYVRGTEAFHAETYKVSVNLVQLCDITYVPKNILRAIQYVTMDGVKYAHPHFLLIDSLRIITDPMTSYWRLDKAFPRMYALQKHYPLLPPDTHTENMEQLLATKASQVTPIIDETLRFLREDLDEKEGEMAVLIGIAAFDRFSQFHSKYTMRTESEDPLRKQVIPFLEIVVVDYAKTVAKLFKRLREMFGDAVKYEEFQRFFDYCGRRGHIYIDGQLAVCVFHHNNRCTPVIPLTGDGFESNTLRTATLSVTALYMLVTKMLCRTSIPPNHRGQAFRESLIYELYSMRSEFLEASKEAIVGNHPFQEFSSMCVGQSIGTLRAHKEETEYRRAHQGTFGMAYFVYEPSQPSKYNMADYKYMNSSGNAVRSRDRLFTPEEGLVEYDDSDKDSGHQRTPTSRNDNNNNKDNKNKYNNRHAGMGQRRKKSPRRKN